MATAPVKSQPLHNFSLPHLKWGHRTHANSNHRFRRRDSPPSASDGHQYPLQQHQPSPMSEPDSEGASDPDVKSKLQNNGSRAVASGGLSFSPCSWQKQLRSDGDGVVLEEEEKKKEEEKDDGVGEAGEAKPWKLRPRKTVTKVDVEIGGTIKENESHQQQLPKSMRLRGSAATEGIGNGSERKGKRKFWISLSREEIEEDIYSLTGSRPARRPKKRPRTIQKQVDNVFPGLYLVGITVDSYKVYDNLR